MKISAENESEIEHIPAAFFREALILALEAVEGRGKANPAKSASVPRHPSRERHRRGQR
jgi:hypothetical protein